MRYKTDTVLPLWSLGVRYAVMFIMILLKALEMKSRGQTRGLDLVWNGKVVTE